MKLNELRLKTTNGFKVNNLDIELDLYELNTNKLYSVEGITVSQNIKEDICAFYGVAVFESTNHVPFDYVRDLNKVYVADNVHPNNKGHAVLATALYRWIIPNIAY